MAGQAAATAVRVCCVLNQCPFEAAQCLQRGFDGSGTAAKIQLCPKPSPNFIFAVAGLPAKRLPNGMTKLTDLAGAA